MRAVCTATVQSLALWDLKESDSKDSTAQSLLWARAQSKGSQMFYNRYLHQGDGMTLTAGISRSCSLVTAHQWHMQHPVEIPGLMCPLFNPVFQWLREKLTLACAGAEAQVPWDQTKATSRKCHGRREVRHCTALPHLQLQREEQALVQDSWRLYNKIK